MIKYQKINRERCTAKIGNYIQKKFCVNFSKERIQYHSGLVSITTIPALSVIRDKTLI